MQIITTQNTIDITLNPSLKEKLNLLLNHTYLASIFEVTDDGKVIIQIGDNKLVADSKVPLVPGEKIFVQVKENTNNMLLLQIVNNVNSQESEKNQQILFRNSIINTLEKLQIPVKEENIGISQKLIKYNLSVSTENIHKIINGLVQSGYQDALKNINVIDKAVMLFSKGLPINNTTVDLADFLNGNKGQVIDQIALIDESLDNILRLIENNSSTEIDNNNLDDFIRDSSEFLEKENLSEVSTNSNLEKTSDKNELSTTNANVDFINNKDTIGKLNEIDRSDNLENKLINDQRIVLNSNNNKNEKLTIMLINNQDKDLNIKVKNNITNQVDLSDLTEDIEKSGSYKNQILETEDSIKATNNNVSDKNISFNSNSSVNGSTSGSVKLDLINSLVILKRVLSELTLKISPSKINNDKEIDIIKNLTELVTIGSKDLENVMNEKYHINKEEILTKLMEYGISVEKEQSQNPVPQHNNIIRVLEEHNNLINQKFNELSKQLEAIKLNNSTNNENNNFYMLPIPVKVDQGNFDNKIYFWSKGNRNNKIDPENMRIVFVLNTQNMGLLKIDLTIVKREVYAGIEVSNSDIKDELEKYNTFLKEKLAAIKYGLRKISYEVKKEENIGITHQDNYLIEKDLSTLDLRI